jgi:superfamily II DNA or RNA helicase
MTENQLIIHNNKKAQFITEDPKLLSTVRKAFSYRIEGYEFSYASQNSGWDGVTYLITPKGSFGSGLVSQFKEYLNDNKIPFTLTDNRKAIIPAQPLDISEKLKSLNLVPRDHQEKILQATIQNSKGIIRSCTGSGKTLTAAMIAAHFNKPTNIYVIGLDLLGQFHDLFTSIFNEKIGYVGNGICDIQRINIVSVWTVGSALRMDKKQIFMDADVAIKEKSQSQENCDKIIKLLETTPIHLFDESHIVASDTIRAIYKIIDPERIYGLSGTPYRDDNTDLLINSILGEQIINISASELIGKDLLAQPIIQFITVPNQQFPDDTYQGVYKKYIVENEVRNNLIIKSVKQLLKQKYVPLVLFKQIKHGEILLELLEAEGIKVALLDGNDSLEKRNKVKTQLYNKAVDVILASTIFDIGINWPILSGLVLAGGGCSSVKATQRVGRILRQGKKYAAVIDFFDQSKFLRKHSKIRYNIYKAERGFKVVKSKEMK